MSALRKNVASQVLTFNLVNATTGAALTGATVTTKVALDGTQGAGSGTVTELGTGQYKYVPTQAETNVTTAGFSFTATNAVPVNLHCFTTASDPTDAVRMGLTALPNAAAEAAGGLFTRGVGAGQIEQEDNGKISINVKQWLRGTIPAVTVTGVPKVDVADWLGAAPNALAGGKVDAVAIVRSATAAAGAASSITLDASASATNSLYFGQRVTLLSGTGAGQSRLISSYNGGTKVAGVLPAWTTAPDATSVFVIHPWASVDVEQWQSSAVASPAAAGVPDVNVKNMNNVAATAITTIKAVQGLAVDGVVPTVTAVTGLTAANLDVAVSTRMATYTQPTGFLAATFPTGTVANTTNITAGTITTVTNLTNAATAGDLTTTMKASVATAVWTDLLASSDFSTANSVGALLKTDVDADLALIATALNSVLALLQDPRGEPAQGAPSVNPSAMAKLDYLYKSWRNLKTNDGTTTKLYADDGTTVDHKQTTSVVAGVVSKAEWVTGP